MATRRSSDHDKASASGVVGPFSRVASHEQAAVTSITFSLIAALILVGRFPIQFGNSVRDVKLRGIDISLGWAATAYWQ